MPKQKPQKSGAGNLEEQLITAMAGYIHDPLGFVIFSYPWGKKGTPLANETGPDKWQAEVLRELGELTYKQAYGGEHSIGNMVKKVGAVIQYAIKAGRDPGKTCLLAWIIHWFISTRPNPVGTVTANTKAQLSDKTWRELAKWHSLSVHEHWFEWTAEKFSLIRERKTWFIKAIPWSKENPQAVAGQHETYNLVIFDEASVIVDIIWDTFEGGLTDPYCLWIVAGNPTENKGRFKDCFPPHGKFWHRWVTKTIDSRDAKRPNKEKIAEWVEDYGENSDFVKVWVKGEFPGASLRQFIPESIVDEAIEASYKASEWVEYPIILGVDVASGGGDQCVIYVRQGYRTVELFKYRPDALDKYLTMTLANHVANYIQKYTPQSVFVDVVGIGRGTVDRLRQLGYLNVFEVNGGMKASDEETYADKNAELWDAMRTWLRLGGSIPNDPDLRKGLINREAGWEDDKRKRLKMQRKKDMEVSPDEADGLAYTFAMPVKFDMTAIEKTDGQREIDEVMGVVVKRTNTYIDFGGI